MKSPESRSKTVEHTMRRAGADEVETLARLINSAFEVERFFKAGDRTSPAAVGELLSKGVMLIAEGSEGGPLGSVYVELREDRVYIGMVSVDPRNQGQGLGHALMAAAEGYGRARGCSFADITVVNLRTDLLPFYGRLGYVQTGTTSFPPDQHTTRECHLLTMSKPLPAPREVWLRGAIPGVPPALMPVAHSLMQVREELERTLPFISPAQLWARPGAAASIGYHVRHLTGSLDRLLTYARGEQLTPAQFAFLGSEGQIGPESPSQLLQLALDRIDAALAQTKATREERLDDERRVGRGALPSTVRGLLCHAAEHAQRHAGQVATTIRVVD